MNEQMSFLAPNGYIRPCPHKGKCGAYKLSDGVKPDGTTYTRGCDGACYWCGHYDRRKKQ